MIVFTGCDSDNGTDSAGAVTFEGRVTDDAGFGKRAAAIEGAVVTAANLEANGSLRALAGEATTNAQGEFSLEVDAAADNVVLTAEKGSFDSDVLVINRLQGSGTVRAMPMTVESEAEVAVYVEATRDGTAPDVITVADVAAHINQRLAAEWKAETITAAQIAAALEAAARAEGDYFAEDEEAEVDENEVRQAEESSFLTLQAQLNAATTVSAQAEAITDFEEALIDAYTDAGASLEAQAKARQTARAALIKFFTQGSAEARLALRQKAEILTSLATSSAIEAAFEAEGASEARLDALAAARTNLIAGLRTAASESAIINAQAAYEADVEAEVMAQLGIDALVLAAVETALATAKTTLDASVDAASNAGAVASAHATFYTTAEASAETALGTSGSADMGASVLTLLTVH